MKGDTIDNAIDDIITEIMNNLRVCHYTAEIEDEEAVRSQIRDILIATAEEYYARP